MDTTKRVTSEGLASPEIGVARGTPVADPQSGAGAAATVRVMHGRDLRDQEFYDVPCLQLIITPDGMKTAAGDRIDTEFLLRHINKARVAQSLPEVTQFPGGDE